MGECNYIVGNLYDRRDNKSRIINTAIFSGRFDPLHTGHILTITKLLKKYSTVVVVILDYPDRTLTAEEVKQIIEVIFEHNSNGNVIAVINNIHFGIITQYEYLQLLNELKLDINNTIYLSGNQTVIDNFDKLGIRNEFVQRSGDYSGTQIRESISNVKEYYSIYS